MEITRMRADQIERASAQRSERRRRLLEAAMAEARVTGFARMTREAVANVAGMSHGCVNHEFGTMAGLREAVMHEAVRESDLAIIAQGLAAGDPIAKTAQPEVRAAAVAYLI